MSDFFFFNVEIHHRLYKKDRHNHCDISYQLVLLDGSDCEINGQSTIFLFYSNEDSNVCQKHNVSFTDLKLAMDPKNYQETIIE